MKRSTLKSMYRVVAAAAVLFVPVGMTEAFAQGVPAPADQQSGPRTMLPPQQLDNLVAPLALYPDPLLGQVLAASTYPLEVVEANQWLQDNRNLTGTALMDAAKQQNWDPSVQALVAFPDVLARLNQDVRWTTDLGNAFLAQQADVMAAIQRLRTRAQANGKLRTTPQETVTDQTQNGQTDIAIQPADPQVIYVPTYDPAYIWGPPAWGYYPPLFYPTYGFGWGFGIPIGGFYLGWGGWGGWGWGLNWFGGGLFINGGFFGRYGYGGAYGYRAGFNGRGAWNHNYARSARATGAGGYSRSYATAANRGSAGAGYRGSAGAGTRGSAGAGYRGSAASSGYRGSAGSSYRGSTGQSYNRSGAAGASRGYSSAQRSYSAPSRSYSAPSRSYSAPSRSYSGGSAGRSYSAPRSSGGGGGFHSSGGGGFHGGGGGGSHGGGRR